jgi:Fe2+ transport system protein FeoA
MAQTPLTLRRWERDEYERLVQLGMFRGEPIELIGGQLIVSEPHRPPIMRARSPRWTTR